MVKEIGDVRYEVIVMPLEDYKKANNPEWQSDGNENDYIYVKLRLRNNKSDVDMIKWNVVDESEYQKRLQFFNNEIASATHIAYEDQQYYALESIYENNYGMSPNIDVVMVFRNPQPKESIKHSNLRFVFEDRVFTKQILKFRIN